jgi:hypothetical protein
MRVNYVRAKFTNFKNYIKRQDNLFIQLFVQDEGFNNKDIDLVLQ